jgi:hypothetical protein
MCITHRRGRLLKQIQEIEIDHRVLMPGYLVLPSTKNIVTILRDCLNFAKLYE